MQVQQIAFSVVWHVDDDDDEDDDDHQQGEPSAKEKTYRTRGGVTSRKCS
jgi:hypothetical protein